MEIVADVFWEVSLKFIPYGLRLSDAYMCQ